MSDPVVRRRKLSEYQQHPDNPNRGSLRGRGLIEDSLQRFGAGRSLVADKNGVLVAGNQTSDAAFDVGLQDVIEVETDGHELVIVRRTDWDLSTDDAPRAYAVIDNRSQELSLDWDAEVLMALQAEAVDLGNAFDEDELAALVTAAAHEAIEQNAAYTLDTVPDVGEPVTRREDAPARYPLAVVLTLTDYRRWLAYKEQIGVKDDTRAFLKLLEERE